MASPNLRIGAQLHKLSKKRVCLPKILVEQIAKPGEKVAIYTYPYEGKNKIWIVQHPRPSHKTLTVDKDGNLRLTIPKNFHLQETQAWWHGAQVIFVS